MDREQIVKNRFRFSYVVKKIRNSWLLWLFFILILCSTTPRQAYATWAMSGVDFQTYIGIDFVVNRGLRPAYDTSFSILTNPQTDSVLSGGLGYTKQMKGINAHIGFMAHKLWSMEFGIDSLRSHTVSSSQGILNKKNNQPLGNIKSSIGYHGIRYGLDFLGYYSLNKAKPNQTGSIDLIGKVGFGMSRITYKNFYKVQKPNEKTYSGDIHKTKNKWGIRIGIGLQYTINKHINTRIIGYYDTTHIGTNFTYSHDTDRWNVGAINRGSLNLALGANFIF